MSDHDPNEETIASLLHTIALIREAAGCGGEVMLADLPAFVKGLREERDKAQRELCSVLSGFDPRKAKAFSKRRGWDCFNAPHANATDVPVQNGGE